ncbi:MAG: hypothetical protein K6E30_04980, partial [Lachnospiraceae bacterium]|nr:hypothetical protein [Lachnospiraceae bacterium]
HLGSPFHFSPFLMRRIQPGAAPAQDNCLCSKHKSIKSVLRIPRVKKRTAAAAPCPMIVPQKPIAGLTEVAHPPPFLMQRGNGLPQLPEIFSRKRAFPFQHFKITKMNIYIDFNSFPEFCQEKNTNFCFKYGKTFWTQQRDFIAPCGREITVLAPISPIIQ